MKDTKRMVCRKTVFFMLLFLMIGGMNMQASETEWVGVQFKRRNGRSGVNRLPWF